MRIAIISDIHANLEALTTVLEDIKQQSIDLHVCLGDIVGYGPNPNECIDIIRENCPISLLGNHDSATLDSLSTQSFNINAKIAIEWTQNQLTEQSRAYIASLELIRIESDITFVHATPYEPKMWYYVSSVDEVAFNFQYFDTRFCFVGHSHIPLIVSMDTKKNMRISQENKLLYNKEDNLHYLINVGSVGQPRDRNPKASYGILDTAECTYMLRRLDYDIATCQNKMRKNKLPEFLITRLSEGR